MNLRCKLRNNIVNDGEGSVHYHMKKEIIIGRRPNPNVPITVVNSLGCLYFWASACLADCTVSIEIKETVQSLVSSFQIFFQHRSKA